MTWARAELHRGWGGGGGGGGGGGEQMLPLKIGKKKRFKKGFEPLTSCLECMILNHHTTMPPLIIFMPPLTIFFGSAIGHEG